MLAGMDKAEIEALGLGLFRVTWTWEAEWLVLAPAGSIEKVREVAEAQGFRDIDPDDDPEVSVSDEIKCIEKWAAKFGKPVRLNEPDASLVDDDFRDVEELLADRIADLLRRLYDGVNMVCGSCGHAAEVDDFIRDTAEPVCPRCRSDVDWKAGRQGAVDDKTLPLFKEE